MMSKNMTRRGFVKASAVAGASAMLAACGGNSGSGAATDGATKKALYFGQSNPKEGFDMQKSTNSGESAIADSIVESPLRWTEDNVLVTTFLTEIPSFEDDGVTLPCEIKEGVKFHDGTPLTSADVKYSFERMFKPATAAKSTYMYDMLAGAKEMLAGEIDNLDEGITIEDDRHFTFHLAAPMVTFINNLGISYAHIFPKDACEAAGDDWGMGLNMIGTGKYKLAENDDTTEVVLVKNADYYDGEPALDEVHYVFYDDNATKVNALKAGEIDWCDLDAALLKEYSEDPETKDKVVLYDTLGVMFIALNNSSANLSDYRVRQALSLGINREEILNNIMGGAGKVASGWLCPSTPGWDADAPDLAYDPAEAKKLLAEAGATNLTLKCETRNSGSYVDIMTAVQGMWKEIGVTLDVQGVDSGIWSDDRAAGNIEVDCLGWFPLYADADNHLYTYFAHTSSDTKSVFYHNDEFDALVDQARVELDPDKRADLYKQAEDIAIRHDMACIPLWWPKRSFVAQPYVVNAKVGNLIYHMVDVDVDPTHPDYPTDR